MPSQPRLSRSSRVIPGIGMGKPAAEKHQSQCGFYINVKLIDVDVNVNLKSKFKVDFW